MTVDGLRPWCQRCEWNLDDIGPVDGGWLARSVTRIDRRAGLRADRWLAERSVADPVSRPGAGQLFLCAVSAIIVLLTVALWAVGLWLVFASGFFPAILLGVALVAVGYGLRPRLSSVRRTLRGRHRLDPAQAPALHALIHEVADRCGAPRPHIVALDEDWNASVAVVGFRRTRILTLGTPLLVALRGPELVALLGHELGHLLHQDSRRILLTQPATSTFGLMAVAVQPPAGDAHDRDVEGVYALFYTIWQLVAGALCWLLFIVHLGLNIVDAHDRRRVELRADLIAARAAGTTGALALLDVLAQLPLLVPYLAPTGNVGGALRQWRTDIMRARERHEERLPLLRQLSIRSDAALLASHSAPGRRHQVLSGRPPQEPSVVVSEADAARIDAEIAPYVEGIRRRLADHHEL
ncbi:M48 family metallopeptidase [Solwaraspora sp. WMMA2056]|uniref:M48 family metallopeptidase n=1 Tax=Solwaraspora sp. WMMA2056 TaxID=3015161 RepID=UPI00259BC09D|nr:M48 family metallopeptidase [Solwaraspora sp. WMMA2056]WJK40661.1 M48 family metallopeptidase [Solwaraspora sp. WMMA2056]